ncbi:sulfotransferase [Aurantibacter sp.]|uniref:sulfotransferase n=1 Tax=Aurantibacter sp. TaxID=2807103 RepID=UPI003267F832
MNFLFLSGAPRSGTSALTELISSHSEAFIGMERFKHLYKVGKVKKSLFTKEKFFDISVSETSVGVRPGKYREYYDLHKSKYENVRLVGDKYPQLYKFWPALMKEFGEGGKYIFIYRDIFSVASSFNVRAQNPKDRWPEENDYKAAVDIWNKSLELAVKAIRARENIYVVEYEGFFEPSGGDRYKELKGIVSYLDLTECSLMNGKYDEMCDKYIKNIKGKEKNVQVGQIDYIKSNARFDLCDELRKYRLNQG